MLGTTIDRIHIDDLVNCKVIVIGGSGNDTIIAGSGEGLIAGGQGNDLIYGSSVNDTLIGGVFKSPNRRGWGRY
jgi:Ca2+-binding RTX toxin-like protein